MKLFLLLFSFSLFFTSLNAQKYYTRADGNWSNLGPDSTDCGCTPNLTSDSVFVFHTLTSGDNNVTYSQSSYLFVGNGGLIDVTAGGQPSRTINGTMIIAAGGKVEANNNLTLTIGSTGYMQIETGGEIEYNNNVDFINNGTLILNGSVTGRNNSTVHFSGGSTVEINGELNVEDVTNETNITGTGKITYSGTFDNSNGTLNGCNSCNTASPVYMFTKTPTGDVSNVTIFDDGSWSNGVPDNTMHALVMQSYTVTQNLESISLGVGSNGDLTISSGNSFTVNDSLVNDGIMTIENNAGLIQYGSKTNSGSGTFLVEKEGNSGNNKFNAWSSPVPGQKITEVFTNTNLYDLFIFDAQNQQWKYDYGMANPENQTGGPPGGGSYNFPSNTLISGANGIMDAGAGYFIPGNAVRPTRDFTGNEVHNGDYTVPVYAPGITSGGWSGTNWNLLGNPYPSGLSAADFINENGSEVNNAIYLWDNANGSYLSYNNTDSLIMVSCQGFWVKANATGNVVFKNSMRSYDASSQFRSGTVYAPAAYLSMNTSEFTDQLRVYVSELAEDGIDDLFDANKMQNPNGTNFYSLIDSGEYVFQSVTPPSLVEDKRIPLSVEHHTDTVLTISADSVTGGSPYLFYLHDKKQSQVTELKKGVEVEFDYESGSDQYRFELLVKLNQSETAPEDAGGDLNPQVISSTGRFEILNSTPQTIKTARVYDLSGREMALLQNIEAGSVRQTPQLKSGIFIVRFEYESGAVEAEKVYVK